MAPLLVEAMAGVSQAVTAGSERSEEVTVQTKVPVGATPPEPVTVVVKVITLPSVPVPVPASVTIGVT
jgi:hypothetical protein